MIRFFLSCFLVLTVFGGPVLAQSTDIPCYDVVVEIASGDEDVWLFNLPDATGSAFTEAQLADGSIRDASITLTLLDCFGDPIANFPAEDIWLESEDGEMVPCFAGSTADDDTDANGMTHWIEPMRAGGASDADCRILVNGESWLTSPLPLHFTSADINGDGVVNLADVGGFSTHFFGTFNPAGDFFHDGVMNLVDVGRLATGLGRSCP